MLVVRPRRDERGSRVELFCGEREGEGELWLSAPLQIQAAVEPPLVLCAWCVHMAREQGCDKTHNDLAVCRVGKGVGLEGGW